MSAKTKKLEQNSAPRTSFWQAVTYGLGDLGTNLAYCLISTYITLYFTDGAKLPAAAVGTMMLVCRVLDGASDIAMGSVIEKTHTRWGKCRPWFVGSILPFFVGLLLLFRVPESLGGSAKLVYCYVTYIFMTVIAYTASNLSYTAMLSRFTYGDEDRTRVHAIRMVITMVGNLIASSFTLNFIEMLGGEGDPNSWRVLSLIYAIICAVLHIISGLFTKERSEEELNAEVNAVESKDASLKSSLKAVLTCKYFYLALALFVVFYTNVGLMTIASYYARDVLGNEGYMAPLMASSIGITFLVFPLLPVLSKKFGKQKLCIFAAGLIMLSGLLLFLLPKTLLFTVLCFLVTGIGQGFFMGLILTYCSDIVDYVAARTGLRTEGFSFASYTFGSKVGTGIGSALVAWGLALGSYDANLSAQAPVTAKAIHITAAGGRLVCGAILLLIMLFLDFGKAGKKAEG